MKKVRETGMLRLGMPLVGTPLHRTLGWIRGECGGSVGGGHAFGFTAEAARRACCKVGLEIVRHEFFGNHLTKLRRLYPLLPARWAGAMQTLTLRKPREAQP